MLKKGSFVSHTADELSSMSSDMDWAKVDAASQQDIERLADEEDGPLPDGWENTVILGVPEPKKDVHIRLDMEVLRWFKAHGPGYQTRINAVLRAFVQARQQNKQGHDHL